MITVARGGGETGAAGGDRRRRRSGGAIMCTRRIFGLAVVALLTLGGRARAYTNQWATHIDGGEEVARLVAEDYGFRYLGKVSHESRTRRSGPGLSLSLLLIIWTVAENFPLARLWREYRFTFMPETNSCRYNG